MRRFAALVIGAAVLAVATGAAGLLAGRAAGDDRGLMVAEEADTIPGPLRAFKVPPASASAPNSPAAGANGPASAYAAPPADPADKLAKGKRKPGPFIAETDPAKRRYRGVFRAGMDGNTGSGTVLVQPTSSAREIRFDDFKISDAPDLEILLVAGDRFTRPEDVLDSKRVSIGRLKRAAGKQVYRVPAEVDPSTYRTVVIWSKRHKLVVTSARLEPSS